MPSILHPHPDAIAGCVLQAFHALPSKFKPRKLADGRREWVPLAGIVLSRSGSDRLNNTGNADGLTCAAVATGMKCIPQSKVPFAKGNVLHDSHAEVLAIRAFNRFLVDECADLARRGLGARSRWVRWREMGQENAERPEGRQPFELEDDVTIHMYASECPCGDASMELQMAAQEDATPWAGPTSTDMLGRGHFDQLGIVRRKPARADAPLTLSKSCSDKLALKQVTGLLSGILAKLFWPGNVYISTLVLPEEQVVRKATERAWGSTGRMAPLTDVEGTKETWQRAGYAFRPFEVHSTTTRFEYSKPVIETSSSGEAAVPSNLSAVHTSHVSEIIINGVLQGRKQCDPRGASAISRRQMWQSVLDACVLAVKAAEDDENISSKRMRNGLVQEIMSGTYAQAKFSPHREDAKRIVKKEALMGWKNGEGDDEWTLYEDLP